MTQNMTPSMTGKYLVLLREDSVSEGVQLLSETIATPDSDTLVFGELGVAVVDSDPTQLNALRIASQDSPILAVEPEQVLYALQDAPSNVAPLTSANINVSMDYLRGYRDAVTTLTDSLMPANSANAAPAEVSEAEATWGLQLTKVLCSQYSGAGIKVAVLDTGFNLTHPDFLGRNITAKSFIEGEDVQDGHGHGTHCIGTACGSKIPGVLPRYGVAYDAEIFVGKVLSNQGSGTDSQILRGIAWAIANGCDIISMSLGGATQPGQSYSRIYEAIAQRALRRGTLIVAAAGNESDRRSGVIKPVGRPANSPSILAVAAIDAQLQVANFSTQGINPYGGQIDIAAPGVKVRSSWIEPLRYRTINGTSMATPHVAGIAALHAEATGLRGQELWNLLVRSAQRLPLPSVDVGAGLVQAP
jgi:subtilisin family serine protease